MTHRVSEAVHCWHGQWQGIGVGGASAAEGHQQHHWQHWQQGCIMGVVVVCWGGVSWQVSGVSASVVAHLQSGIVGVAVAHCGDIGGDH